MKGRIMGIDYGSKRIGIAVTDPEQIIATALSTVNNNDVISFIRNYTNNEKVVRFVVGEAKNLDGSDAQSMPLIRAFIKRLEKEFPAVPIEMENERFTSRNAYNALVASGIGREKRKDKKLVDKVAAVLILQAYLERKNPSN
jgi:putative Holliday junction resolvase